MSLRIFYKRHEKGIKNALGLIFVTIFTLGLCWIGSWQLDMISSPAVNSYWADDAMWWFPFFGDWYSVGWYVKDAYVRMFMFIWAGILTFGIGMFLVGFYWKRKR